MLLLGLVLLVVVLAMAATIVRHHRERSPNCAGPPPLPLLGCSLEAAVHYPNMLDWVSGRPTQPTTTVSPSHLSLSPPPTHPSSPDAWGGGGV